MLRPSSLINPRIDFDSDSRSISVQLQSPATAPSPTAVHISIHDERTKTQIASADAVLGENPIVKQFSTAAANSDSVCVRLQVDKWPSAFVYLINTNNSQQDVQPTDLRAPITISQPTAQLIVPSGSDEADATVSIDLTDSVFRYGRDEITLGLDLNGDNYLIDEPTIAIKTPVGIFFRWAGIGPDGSVAVSNRVAAHRLTLPVGPIQNQRAQLLARLKRGTAQTWSRPWPVVFDTLPPKIARVEVVSSVPTIAGQQLQVRVGIDDSGLSGAASVKAGWATQGQLEFTHDMVSVAGQKMEDGNWVLAIPTDAVAAGSNVLLIQPTDAAGNVGLAKAVPIRVQTSEQVAETKRKQSTVVVGKVAYVTRPVKGMTVSLTPVEAKETDSKPSENSGDNSAQSQLAHPAPSDVQTADDGTFRFPIVHAGKYELTVKGIYRGMRRNKSIKVAVAPPEPTTAPTIRID